MNNYLDTIITQYANADKLKTLIKTFNDAVDPSDAINNFYDLVWNIDTADTYGLDVWGKIFVVNRLLTLTENKTFFGFNEASSTPTLIDDPQPFGQAPFYSGEVSSSTFELTDDAFRKLIMLKAMSNITDCSIPSMNAMLMYMFGAGGNAYVRNDGDMTMSYVFGFVLSPAELAIVQSSGALPSPAGVTVNIIQEV